MHTILIAGGTGLIGSRLSLLLKEQGHTVRHLSRKGDLNAQFPAYQWDLQQQTIDPAALDGVTHVINLAGAGIADARWTAKRKAIIINSRTESNKLLQKAIPQHGQSVKKYISSSAIGFYGDMGSRWCHETDGPGNGFLSESTLLWEQSIEALRQALQLPTLVVRTGIVLSTQGGALPKMLLPLHFGLTTWFGSGQQYYSWIHIDDLCRIFIRGIEEDGFTGVYNGTAPDPATGKSLAKALPPAKGSWAIGLPAPAFALRLALGEMADTVLVSTRCSPDKLLAEGFQFLYTKLDAALKDVISKKI